MIISAFEELQKLGHLGPECLILITKLIREEAKRFPVLTPMGGWQQADQEDLTGDFLDQRLEEVTANLLALATDDSSVGRLLRKSIRNWLVDQARHTAAGAIRRTIEKVFGRAAPHVPHVYTNLPSDSPHRYSDGSLCMWYPADPADQRWVLKDGPVALLGHIIAHLLREEWWRRAGEWPGEEAAHLPISESDDTGTEAA